MRPSLYICTPKFIFTWINIYIYIYQRVERLIRQCTQLLKCAPFSLYTLTIGSAQRARTAYLSIKVKKPDTAMRRLLVSLLKIALRSTMMM